MSLKSFISQNQISNVLKVKINKPKFEYNKNILVEAKSSNFTNVGIAFDYLMRIYLYRLNKPYVKGFEMFAESALVESILGKERYVLSLEIVNQTKKQIDIYLENGILNDELISLCLKLAHIDIFKRTSIITDDFGSYDKNDIEDLKNLYNLMQNHEWKCKERCELNPNFNLASLLVGGADADLIIDDMLIDIKTIKGAGMSRQHFNQLLGYYFLSRIEGRVEIKRIGIYSARYSEFMCFDIADLFKEDEVSELTNWFYEEAYKQYGSIYELGKSRLELLEIM